MPIIETHGELQIGQATGDAWEPKERYERHGQFYINVAPSGFDYLDRDGDIRHGAEWFQTIEEAREAVTKYQAKHAQPKSPPDKTTVDAIVDMLNDEYKKSFSEYESCRWWQCFKRYESLIRTIAILELSVLVRKVVAKSPLET